jgi:hypothetical protein
MRTNHRLAQLWLDALATELGAGAGTIDTYTDDLNCYLVWLDENSFCLNDIGLEQIWLPIPFLLRKIGRYNDPRDISIIAPGTLGMGNRSYLAPRHPHCHRRRKPGSRSLPLPPRRS